MVPFKRWRRTLGNAVVPKACETSHREADGLALARHLAEHVDRAAWRLPFEYKCLPRAMALSWLLQRSCLEHSLVIAIRPPDRRDGEDSLHAWVEVGGTIVLGELPGPWHEIYRT